MCVCAHVCEHALLSPLSQCRQSLKRLKPALKCLINTLPTSSSGSNASTHSQHTELPQTVLVQSHYYPYSTGVYQWGEMAHMHAEEEGKGGEEEGGRGGEGVAFITC